MITQWYSVRYSEFHVLLKSSYFLSDYTKNSAESTTILSS